VSDSGLGTTDWTFTAPVSVSFTTSPLAVGALVFVGASNGDVYAVNASSGVSEGSVSAGTSDPTYLAAGEGVLVVVDGNKIVAYDSAGTSSGSTPANTSVPTISGTSIAGQAVGVDVGLWTDQPTSYSYQWELCNSSDSSCNNINGATGESYTPPVADFGDYLEVNVSATDSTGTSPQLLSLAQVITEPPINNSAPQITGTAADGETLTASSGSWTQAPSSYSYQWLSCTGGDCIDLPDGTSSTYVVEATPGSQIEVEVVAANADSRSATATSALTSVVPPIPVALTLTSSANPVVSGNSVTFTAEWTGVLASGTITFSEDGAPISGCESVAVDASEYGITCTGAISGDGDVTITASYSGDNIYAAGSESLTEDIIGTVVPPSTPVGVQITGASSISSDLSTVTIKYTESGGVTSTTCTLDGKPTTCSASQAVLSKLSVGKHLFVVTVAGPDGSASEEVDVTIGKAKITPVKIVKAKTKPHKKAKTQHHKKSRHKPKSHKKSKHH